jgi:hypothetical protein
VLSPLDDFPYHQISEPMRHVGTSDRNFYDRYYFNCHGSSDEIFVIVGMGQYPNLGVQDAFALVVHEDQHRVVRASRELGADRGDLSVGPFHIEVLEGLRSLRVRLEPNAWDVELDLTWEGAMPAFLETRHLDRQFGRILFDSTRFAQTGCWTGTINVAGKSFDVTPDRWWGSRDRSWGVRPVGEAEPPGIAGSKPHPGFFWVYAPMQFDDHSMLVIAQERADGTRIIEEAVRVWADPSREPELLGRPEHEIEYVSGTRLARHARLTMTDADGSPLVVEVEPLLPAFIGIGTGYGLEPDWRHGMHQGELVVQGVHHDLTTEAGRAALWGIVDAVSRFEITSGTTAGAVGHGMFEHANIGPYSRYGFKDFLDPAP